MLKIILVKITIYLNSFTPSIASTMLPKSSIALLCALGITLVFLIVFTTDNAQIGYGEVRENETFTTIKVSLYMTRAVMSAEFQNRKVSYSLQLCKINANSSSNDQREQKKLCDIGTRLRGFSISAVVFNYLALLFPLFLAWKPGNVLYIGSFFLLMTGLLVGTSGIIAEQVNLVEFSKNEEFNLHYAFGFYFAIVCLVLEVIVCAWTWLLTRKDGSYASLIRA